MYPLKLHLNWFKDSAGYRFNDFGKRGIYVAGNGGKLVPSLPLDNGNAFSDFASVTSLATLLGFVEKYGLLEHAAYGVKVDQGRTGFISLGAVPMRFDERGFTEIDDAPTLLGEDVAPHLAAAKLFREILDQSGKGWRRTPPLLTHAIAEALDDEPRGEISLALDGKHGFRMVLTANSLMDGLWLQLGQKVAGQAQFRTCELPSCRQIFEVGSSAGRRLDARFCSDSHRIEFNSRKRTKGPE
jgi:hypothetical protein